MNVNSKEKTTLLASKLLLRSTMTMFPVSGTTGRMSPLTDSLRTTPNLDAYLAIQGFWLHKVLSITPFINFYMILPRYLLIVFFAPTLNKQPWAFVFVWQSHTTPN